jgi:homoserine dehydrogenase
MRKKLKLGLFGFGCVGQGLYHVLEETHGLKAEIKRICVKDRNKQRILSRDVFTFQPNDILNDPEIDVVVELIDDSVAAFKILKLALQHGKHVVTANKKMLAENLEEIYHLQQQYDRSVLYEGAVCGSIPILRNLEEYYDNDLLTGIEGIFNGSTNYILTKVFEEKKSYIEALKQAQDLGFAESNPALDVQGFDPKFKLTIAIAHAFGVFVKPENIINIGIDKISDLDLQFARERGYAVKLIARAIKTEGKIFALVAPQFIESENPFNNIRNEYNAVQLQGAFSDKQLFAGKGAGGYPTGSAVLSDISALAYDYRYEYKKIHQLPVNTFSDDWSLEVFVRFPHGESVSIGDFENFKSGYASHGQHYMVGEVGFTKLKEWAAHENIGVILAPGASFVSETSTKKTDELSYAVA